MPGIIIEKWTVFTFFVFKYLQLNLYRKPETAILDVVFNIGIISTLIPSSSDLDIYDLCTILSLGYYNRALWLPRLLAEATKTIHSCYGTLQTKIGLCAHLSFNDNRLSTGYCDCYKNFHSQCCNIDCLRLVYLSRYVCRYLPR